MTSDGERSDVQADDNDSVMAGEECTWLPGMAEHMPTPVDAFLESLGGRMRILGCRYEGAQLRSVATFDDGRHRSNADFR